MKKIVLAAAVAVTLATGATSPAFAAEKKETSEQTQTSKRSTGKSSSGSFTSGDPIRVLIGLLLPAVQA